MKHLECPSCRNTDVDDFFVIKDAPVQSIVTVNSHEEAIKIPRKDITLTFCNTCGFIYNSTFDTTIDHYTRGYEDQQGFSPTFTKFLKEVTGRFINKYDIYQKDIIEIGCGKGDFLELMCELGDNKGIGIDPAYVPGRSKPNPKVSFVKEFYSEEHGNLPADVIACRHTLEHIHNADEFVKTVRKSIQDDNDVTVLIEVPSITRILKIQAFWDIFYEHCSYFSPGSLARLFRRNKFEVIDTYLEYANQYLLLEAIPVNNISQKSHALEESVKQLRKHVDEFVVKINIELDKWRRVLLRLKKGNKKVVIWGGGSKSVGFLTHFDDLGVVKNVVDINPFMQGNFIPGIGIQYVAPEFLKKLKPDTVIIMNGIYENEIGNMLAQMKLYPELICL